MRTLKGPAIFVAQYVSDEAPFNTLQNIATWAKSTGFKGIQLPIDSRLIDISKASTDKNYCQTILRELKEIGIEVTELSSHLQGQLIAVHPAYDIPFDGQSPIPIC